jgi:rhodanese-related sulfurtransferase
MKPAAIVLAIVVLTGPALYAHTDLTPAEVAALLDPGGNVLVVDVREETEFCDSTYSPPGHIPGAINMPWNSGYLQAHYGELASDDTTIIVCRSGSRSNAAANFLDSVGFTEVFDMLGGMSAWQYETENCATAGVEPGAGRETWGDVKIRFREQEMVP